MRIRQLFSSQFERSVELGDGGLVLTSSISRLHIPAEAVETQTGNIRGLVQPGSQRQGPQSDPADGARLDALRAQYSKLNDLALMFNGLSVAKSTTTGATTSQLFTSRDGRIRSSNLYGAIGAKAAMAYPYCAATATAVCALTAATRIRLNNGSQMIGAVTKRLREEFGKLQVEINDEKSRTVDLERSESFGFLGLTSATSAVYAGRCGRIIRPSSKSGRH